MHKRRELWLQATGSLHHCVFKPVQLLVKGSGPWLADRANSFDSLHRTRLALTLKLADRANSLHRTRPLKLADTQCYTNWDGIS